MGGLAKSLASVPGLKAWVPSPGMPDPGVPGGLGLPEKSTLQGVVTGGGRDDHSKFIGNSQQAKYAQERAKAENYNKAFAELLNQQAHLNGAERKNLYDLYSDKFIGDPKQVENARLPALTDFSSTLSQLTPEQYQAQLQQQQSQAASPAPQTSAPASQTSAPAPATAGPVTQPQVEATPTTATPTGNIAGTTTTLNSDVKAKSSGRRGRVATLLTGLGGAVERFGL